MPSLLVKCPSKSLGWTHFSVDESLCDEEISFEGENDGGGQRVEISEGQKDRPDPVSVQSSGLERLDVVQEKVGSVYVPPEREGQDKILDVFLHPLEMRSTSFVLKTQR